MKSMGHVFIGAEPDTVFNLTHFDLLKAEPPYPSLHFKSVSNRRTSSRRD